MSATMLLDARHYDMLSRNPSLQEIDYFLAYVDGWRDASEMLPPNDRSDILVTCTLYRSHWEERRAAYFVGG